MNTVLIVGASRGIGLETCRQYLADGWQVFATHRCEPIDLVVCNAGVNGPRYVRVLTLHPGGVRTDMGGPNANVAVQTSVTGLRSVVANAERFPGGGFYDYRGERLEW